MKKISVFIFLVLSVNVFAQKITLQDIWINYSYFGQSASGFRSFPDGKYYTVLGSDKKTITKISFETQTAVAQITVPLPDSKSVDFYRFSADGNKILVGTDIALIYRYSRKYNYYVYDTQSKKLTPLYDKGKQKYATFSPDGNKVAFVSNNNLYYKDLKTDAIIAITFDGKKNKIINGSSDWVYEEEFTLTRAYQWSPDGQSVAFLKFDESEVPLYELNLFKDKLYPPDLEYKYPKVGQENSDVTLHMYNIKTNKVQKVALNDTLEYIPRIKWNPGKGNLVVFTMNRLQNTLNLYEVSPATMGVRLIYTEKSDTYIEIHDVLEFVNDGESFIWLSAKNGYKHLYLINSSNGKEEAQITSGKFAITEVFGLSQDDKYIFYASTEVSPLQRHIYKIRLNGNGKKQLTNKPGWHSADFTKYCNYFVDNYSSAGVPPVFTLKNKNGQVLDTLVTNKRLKKKLDKLNITKPEFFSFKIVNGVSLNGYMIKPADFDKNKNYPVLMYVYGGPGSQEVIDCWGGFNYMWFQMLAQKGYIIVCVDNRGTGGRGRQFRTITYENLGKIETKDQILAAKYLGTLPYIDERRIGIWGWSYGGYMSSLCILKGSAVFAAAIAVAPVTNWKFYDSIYTERYMGTMQSNPGGFDKNAPISYANQLQGNYLLVHGTGDDNVHWQNTAEMINALVAANKQFDMVVYPDRNHSIFGGFTRFHLYKKMTNFLLDNL